MKLKKQIKFERNETRGQIRLVKIGWLIENENLFYTEKKWWNETLFHYLSILNEDSSNTIQQCIQAGILNAGTNEEYVTNGNNAGYYPWVAVGDSGQYLD